MAASANAQQQAATAGTVSGTPGVARVRLPTVAMAAAATTVTNTNTMVFRSVPAAVHAITRRPLKSCHYLRSTGGSGRESEKVARNVVTFLASCSQKRDRETKNNKI